MSTCRSSASCHELWQAAHQRLAVTRATYLRATGGRLMGRLEGQVDSPHLFTGFLKCGECGGSMQFVKQPTRRGRLLSYYRCGTHLARGVTRCPTGGRVQVAPLEEAVLEALEAQVLSEETITAVVARVMARRAERATQGRDRRAALERELAQVRASIGRYVQALGAGVAMDEIRAALETAKLREQALLGEIVALSPLTAAQGALDRAALRHRLTEWRSLLRQGPQVARQLSASCSPRPAPSR